jgi:hypothetical protein
MRLLQEGAERALLLLQPFDQRDRIIRCAAHAVFVRDKPFERVLALWHDKARLVVVEVAEIALKPPAGIGISFLAGLGDVHRANKAQPRRVHAAPVLGRDVAGDLPVGCERVIAERVGRGDADHPEIVFAGKPPARGRDRADDGDLGIGPGVGQEVQARPFHRVPVGLLGDDLALEEAQDCVERLGHAVALGQWVDPHHDRVRGEEARPGSKHDAAARHMVELDDAVGDHHRVVVGQRDDAGAEADVAGALGGEGDKDLGGRDDLEPGRMVLADPRLVKAKPVEPDHQLEIALEALGRVLLIGMKRRQKDPVPKVDFAHCGLASAPALYSTELVRDRKHSPAA